MLETTKGLVSQEEVDALFDESEALEPLSFDKRMGRVSLFMEGYLRRLGLEFEELRMVKSISNSFNNHFFKTDYEYLDSIAIDNSLALTLLSAQFGATQSDFSIDRKLSYLERRLIEQLLQTVVETAKKELDTYFVNDDGLEIIADYSLLVSKGIYQGAIDFTFSKELFAASSVIVVESEPAYQSGGTEVQAVIGTVEASLFEKGDVCVVKHFDDASMVLLFDNDMSFASTQTEIGDVSSMFTIEEAFERNTFFSSHYISIASARIDDETLMALDYGEKLTLTRYKDTEIHKDGTMLAKAKVTVLDGAIALEIV